MGISQNEAKKKMDGRQPGKASPGHTQQHFLIRSSVLSIDPAVFTFIKICYTSQNVLCDQNLSTPYSINH